MVFLSIGDALSNRSGIAGSKNSDDCVFARAFMVWCEQNLSKTRMGLSPVTAATHHIMALILFSPCM